MPSSATDQRPDDGEQYTPCVVTWSSGPAILTEVVRNVRAYSVHAQSRELTLFLGPETERGDSITYQADAWLRVDTRSMTDDELALLATEVAGDPPHAPDPEPDWEPCPAVFTEPKAGQHMIGCATHVRHRWSQHAPGRLEGARPIDLASVWPAPGEER